MCKLGNQTITKGCYEALLKQTGRLSLSNQEARILLREQGGCAVNRKELAGTVR